MARSSSLRDCFAEEIERSVTSIGAMTCNLTDPHRPINIELEITPQIEF